MPFAVLFLPGRTVMTLPPPSPLIPSPVHGGGSGWGPLEFGLSIWLLGCSCILARELLATIGLARWRHHAQPLASARWAETLARISATQDLGTHRMRVFESRLIASPCTWGVLRPVLLLPTAGDAWPESARRSALLHELAHVRRHDALTSLVMRLACALHWYNPLVWLAAGRVRRLQERACDDAVLRAGAMPSEYAQFLLDVAARIGGISAPTRTVVGMAHSSLHARIVAILNPHSTRSQPHRAQAFAASASLFAVSILLATASVAVEAPPAPPSPTRPTVPESPSIPAIPSTPAIPAIPAIPATPPTPTIPAIPAIPAIPPTPSDSTAQ